MTELTTDGDVLDSEGGGDGGGMDGGVDADLVGLGVWMVVRKYGGSGKEVERRCLLPASHAGEQLGHVLLAHVPRGRMAPGQTLVPGRRGSSIFSRWADRAGWDNRRASLYLRQ